MSLLSPSRVRAQRCGGHVYKRIDRFVFSSSPLDLSNRGEHHRVMAFVMEAADLRIAPSPDVPRQIHRDMPAERRARSVPLYPPGPRNSDRIASICSREMRQMRSSDRATTGMIASGPRHRRFRAHIQDWYESLTIESTIGGWRHTR